MPTYTDFDIRMKLYEQIDNQKKLIPLLPIMARIDGRAFHSFTRGLKRPDLNFNKAMVNTTIRLCKETNPLVAYTQSDEISLCWYSDVYKTKAIFDGKIQKLTSILASLTSVLFNSEIKEWEDKYKRRLPHFDCRVWNVPSLEEAANCFVWRENDAARNSLSMLAQENFSHKELQGKNSINMHDMLHEKGINWNDLPIPIKRGSYIKRVISESTLSKDKLENLVPHHNAKKNPTAVVRRSNYQTVTFPILSKADNKCELLFSETYAE